MAVFMLRSSLLHKTDFPRICLATQGSFQKKRISSDTKRGTGGRSSFSGVVVTVFGGTGFFGRSIINRLGRVGSQIIAPYRGDEHDYRHLRLMGDLGQIVFPAYNLKDPSSIAKVVKYSNVVINLIGRDYETRNFKFSDVHVAGARSIAEACSAAGVKRLIHFSALGASRDSPSAFLRSKAEGEESVKGAFPDATIVRPAATYGSQDRFINYYASLRGIPFGFFPLLKKGIGIYKYPVFVSDIAQGVVNIINDQSSVGSTYEFVGPNRYQLLDMVDYFYRLMYRSLTPVSRPESLIKFTAWVLEQNPFIPYMTRDILTRLHLTEELTGDLPGLEDVGVTPTPMEEIAIELIRHYRKSHAFKKPIDDMQPLAKH